MFVAINALTVPADYRETLERRFAARAGSVDSFPGFVRFELLRPTSEDGQYLVMTHWQSEADYHHWLESQNFQSSHASGGPVSPVQSDIWLFDVVTTSPNADV